MKIAEDQVEKTSRMNKNVKTFIYNWMIKEWYRKNKPEVWVNEKGVYKRLWWLKEGDKPK